MALQTPRQRAANAKWSKKIEKQHGRPKSTKSGFEFPVSKYWVYALVFLVCGGGILEILHLFF
ncbi:protein Ysy6p [[Candida] anglica]|uniref:Stress-associated endoplasmic reticulum protein n=1 Tax=[Candida] anglica TaxID=148631 RepID=A0ABP0EFT1_9ASCO